LLLAGLAQSAAAQTTPGAAAGVPPTGIAATRPAPPGLVLTLGGGPLVGPAWQGSRDIALSVFPDIRLNYRDDLFFSIPDGLGWNAINQNGWKLGPLVKVRFGRNEVNGGSPFLIAGGSEALLGLGDVGLAGEAGGFAQYSLSQNRLRLRAEVRQGFGGHEGVVADTLITWSDGIAGPMSGWRYGLGLRANFADAAFTNVFFGVDPGQAMRSGLPVFRTQGGLVAAGVNASLTRLLGPRGRSGALTLLVSHEQLGNTATESSLIRLRGQRGQTSVGLFYGYRFRLS
jgi:outer membrane scaffolding protein for murein synthesis (MipA/OmpV family)